MKEDKNSQKVTPQGSAKNTTPKNYSDELKQIEKLQQDGMQEGTIARKKNRIKSRVLILLLLLLLIGIGVAVFFVLQNQRQKDVHIIASVDAVSYLVYEYNNHPDVEQEIGSDKFSFKAEDESTRKYTKEVVCVLEANSTLKIVYQIENKTVNKYSYFVDFAGLTFENVEVKCTNNHGYKPLDVDEENTLYTISTKERFINIIVEIKVDDVNANAVCYGQIDLTLSSVK